MNSDDTLVALAQTGDKQAFSFLYQKYFDSIYRFCYWQVNADKDLAQDLTQDIFVEVAKSIKTFKNKGSFRNWMYTISKRIINKWIKSKYDLPCVPLMFEIAQTSVWIDPEIQKEKIEKVEEILSGLSEKERKIIVLRYFRNYSVAETAKELKLSRSNIKVISHRVIKKLRNNL